MRGFMAPNRTDQAKTNPRESNEREQKKKRNVSVQLSLGNGNR